MIPISSIGGRIVVCSICTRTLVIQGLLDQHLGRWQFRYIAPRRIGIAVLKKHAVGALWLHT